MKIEKWNEKVSAMFDDASMYNSDNLHFDNDAAGAYFCTNGFQAFFMPGTEILTAKVRQDRKVPLSAMFNSAIEHGKLAEECTNGTIKDGKRKARKFSSNDTTVYAQEKFLRVFPKNTEYYISGPTKPILAGIFENGVLHVFGIVMPILAKDFVAA